MLRVNHLVGFGVGEVGTGGGSTPASGWYALVQKSGGDQTITISEAPLTWEADVSDAQNIHDPSTNNTRFTIPAAWNGRYCRMTYNILTVNSAFECYAYGYKDGAGTWAGYPRLDAQSASGVESGNSMSAPFVVATGEYYEVYADDDSTVYDDADSTWAQMEMLPSDFNGALVVKSGTQALSAGTNTDVTWATEVYDLGTWFDSGTSTTELTVPSGVSLIRVSAQVLNESATGQLVCSIQKNNATAYGLPHADHDTTGFDSVNIISAPIAVTSGDDFKVVAFHTSAVNIDGGNGSWFAIEKLPATLKYALVNRSSNQSISATTTTVVNWNAEVADTDSWHDNSTNSSRLTVPSGVSHVRVTANLATGSSVSGQMVATILKNGATVVGCARHETNTAGTDNINLKSAIMAVSPGDYFEVTIYTTQATTVTNANQSWFSIEEVADAT